MKKCIAVAALSILSFSQPAQAEVSISDYEKYKGDEGFKMYLGGYLEGLKWANLMMMRNKLPSLYCPPPELGLTVDNGIQILDDFIEHSKNLEGNDHIEVVMIFAMQNAFPCK
ncbi:MAG TPA: hypothetical protein VN448_05415 [Gammaproteobacteria bacterium]|nr:hypothetical protein [Gammaproteobacteria bacterium]